MKIADGLDNDCDGKIDEEICYSDSIGEYKDNAVYDGGFTSV